MSNSVKRLSRGHYRVTFPGVWTSDGGGHVQVSALSAVPRYCTAASWSGGANPTTILAYVNCYRFDGIAADTAFSAVFLIRGWNSGTIAYSWADQPGATDYMPDPYYQVPGANTVHRSSAGRYLVRLPGFDPDHGNIQITGYGDDLCKTGESSSDGSALIVGVVCPAGDSFFDVLYTKNVGLTGVPRPKAAYLRAFPLRPAGSRLPAQFRYSSAGMAPSINRTAVGTYLVTLPGMPKGGAAHVTAGPGADTCWLTSIRTNATPQRIGVACANLSGAAADAAFDLSYTK